MARQFGLRTEIIVNLCILMGAALLFSGLLLLKLTERALEDQRLNALVTLLEEGGRVVTTSEQPLRAARQFVDSIAESVRLDRWLLVDQNYSLYDFSARETIAFHLDPEQYANIRKEHRTIIERVGKDFEGGSPPKSTFQLTVPLFANDGFAGILQVWTTLNDDNPQLPSLRLVMFSYLLVAGAILVLFGFFLLGRTVIRPIRFLAEATGAVAAGRLETTVDAAGPVEIATLARAFNAMTASLQESRQETLAHIAALEGNNRELREVRAELLRTEKLASVGRLSAGMAHEIGNPLGALIGYLEYLQKEPTASADIVDHALDEARRIDFLVRDLLDYATPEQTPPGPVDPVTVAEEARRVLENQGLFERTTLQARLPLGLPPVSINRQKLLQVLVNLLLNARDAAPAGTITLSAGEDADGIWLSVADDGIGMDEDTASKIFDPFFSTKEPGKGRGLGLTVCHHILHEAGGSISVTSAPGSGSTFVLHFPRSR